MLNTFSSAKKLCIFDLDGTLVNTIADLAASVSYALKVMVFPIRTMEEYTAFVGNGTLKLIERSVPPEYRTDHETVRKTHELFSRYYSDHFADISTVYPGMPEALSELKKRGISLAVLTNKPDAFAKPIISKFFPDGLFDIVRGAMENVPKKPDPTAEIAMMRSIGAEPDNTIHFGDSDVDVLTAHNAGIRCVGCSWGFRTEESLVAAGAEFIVKTPMEILKAVELFGW